MRLGIVRLQFHGPAVAGNRFVQLALVLQRIAQVVVRLGIIRLQFHGPAAAGDRFVQLSLLLEGNAQVVVRLGNSPASVPRPGGSRQLLRPAFPAAARHCPGCCAPRHSPASVRLPGGRRRPLRPACPSGRRPRREDGSHRHDPARPRESADRSARQLETGRLAGLDRNR